MMEAGLDWDDLRMFLMIARHRTLSAAARALGVRQPTMGRRLEALEHRAGACLLQRTPGGFVLTEAGEAILGHAERMEQEALGAARRIAGADVRLEGTVRLTAVETLAAYVLAPVLARFRTLHPGVVVEMIASIRNLSLTKREADIAIRMAPFTQPDLVARKLGSAAYALYASPAYLDAHGVPDWAAGAAGHTLVLTEPDLRQGGEMQYLLAAAPRAVPVLTSNSRLVHRHAAQTGLGLACLARYLADGQPDLVRLSPPAPAPVREIWLGVHADLRHVPRIRAFISALAEGVRSAGPQLAPPA